MVFLHHLSFSVYHTVKNYSKIRFLWNWISEWLYRGSQHLHLCSNVRVCFTYSIIVN